MTTTITNSELERYDKEFEISVCKVLAGNKGYSITYTDKPEPKPCLPMPEIKTPPAKPQEATEPVKTVVCMDCGVEHEEGKPCFICEPLARAMQSFRQNKREYAIVPVCIRNTKAEADGEV